MLYKLVVLPKADNEYYNALNWYGLQQNDLPAKFAADVEISIGSVLRNPESYQQFKRGYRQALMEKFPYFIIYSINKKEEVITIVSIFHTSRHPKQKFRE
ncbi:type II toxin-antitoxin system RelE/ParE family toxin [Mucilaginibacter arboris]|uniref:Type II toxin-antitoxin system RelE/ParE family toxin n=1 Tax=Mucilaginibacter arboris TaxID=2682090 RepID=A0A7K1STP7_9SPHI|nr:type II toxin-antitoxin system RelE/ParE family toxin [Mucilaginibacter arboris]MVN20681.1 hypothetical protein [Mucilaginibacter arboris]